MGSFSFSSRTFFMKVTNLACGLRTLKFPHLKRNDWVHICTNAHGTRAAQKLIDVVTECPPYDPTEHSQKANEWAAALKQLPPNTGADNHKLKMEFPGKMGVKEEAIRAAIMVKRAPSMPWSMSTSTTPTGRRGARPRLRRSSLWRLKNAKRRGKSRKSD